MSRTIMNHVKMNSTNCRATSVIRRNVSYRGVKESIRKYFEPRTGPPFGHVCQVGDPALRAPAQPIEPEIITKPAFQRVIKHMTNVMRTYNAMGLSANQIGLCYQIFVMEVTEKHLSTFTEQQLKTQQAELVPLRVFINPKMKIVDYATLKYTEECASILGYSAVVPRARSVRVEALDTNGKPFVFNAAGWTARIVQHEMDHLQGKLYVDRMDATTFSCIFWKAINNAGGYIKIKVHPKSWIRSLLWIK